jgi:hypothetical protein
MYLTKENCQVSITVNIVTRNLDCVATASFYENGKKQIVEMLAKMQERMDADREDRKADKGERKTEKETNR